MAVEGPMSRQDVSLRLVDPGPKVVGGDGHDVSRGRTYCVNRPRRSFKEAWDLAAAVACVLLLLAAVRYADLDGNYATSIPLTSAIRHMLGLPAFGSHADQGAPAEKLALVAENDDGRRLIAKTTLERYGYAVALADSGSQAVSLFSKAAPRVALVLLDRAELQGSIDSVVYEIKRIRPNARIVVLQGGNSKLAWGVAASVAEPLSAQLLADTVRKVLASN